MPAATLSWRMDWDSEAFRLYVDERLMNLTYLNTTFNPGGSNSFINKPMYLLINLAVGGNNGGSPAGTGFPTTYEIDYYAYINRQNAEPRRR